MRYPQLVVTAALVVAVLAVPASAQQVASASVASATQVATAPVGSDAAIARADRFLNHASLTLSYGSGKTSMARFQHGAAKIELFPFKLGPVRLGGVASVAAFDFETDDGFYGNGSIWSLGLGIVYQRLGMRMSSQTKVTVEGGVRYDRGETGDGDWRTAQGTTLVSGRAEHIVWWSRTWFPELALWFEGAADVADDRVTSMIDTDGDRVEISDKDHDLTWSSGGFVLDIVKPDWGWFAVVPGIGGEVIVTNEDRSTWFQAEARLALLRHHVLVIGWFRAREHRSGSPDEAFGITVVASIWEF